MSEFPTSAADFLAGVARSRHAMGRARAWRPHHLAVLTAAFVVATGNIAFFRHLAAAYPMGEHNAGFLASVAVVQVGLLSLVSLPLAHTHLVKPVAVLMLLLAAAISYFEDTFGIIIDQVIIASILQTNPREAGDLVNVSLLSRLVLLGVLPALFVATRKVQRRSFIDSLKPTLATMSACFAVVVICVLMFSASYASCLRQHKEIRYYTNPLAPVVFAIEYLLEDRANATQEIDVHPIEEDAVIVRSATALPKLVVLVVGEAVRKDHLGINGYSRQTTPSLARRHVYNFTNVASCGTATAVSVPCMFSALPRADFSMTDARGEENVLDVLLHAGVDVRWRDNNSDSKGVALRVRYEDFSTDDRNPVCDVECRDEGMLAGLQESISRPGDNQDTLIVLHQMGNHGPAYYKRYAPGYEHWQPTCKSSELSTCTQQEIVNAYDNALLYTDHFLGDVIEFLERNDDRFQTAMIYVSDHGESLGEYGVYLHGLPYALAPPTQVQVPVLMWFGKNFELGRETLETRLDTPYSHDNIFHTLLDVFDVETRVYQPSASMLAGGRAKGTS